MSFKGVAEAEARKLLAGNAIRCFGLDRDKLLPIARRIGFDPAEVLVDEPNVHPLCVEHFNARGGILQPPEQINLKDVDTLFAEDLRLVDTV